MENNNFLKGAIVGMLAGAVTGILFAPKSGKETREDIKHIFEEMKAKVLAEVQKAKDFSRKAYDKAVSNTISSYREAKRITPEDAAKIKEIFDESFERIQEIVKSDISDIKKPQKKTLDEK